MKTRPGSHFRQTLASLTAPSAEELARPLVDGRLECLACGHRCRIAEGNDGVCRVRGVRGGVLRRPAGYVAALASDPIEKKPFFHAFPGRNALTFGMLGCDLRCPYCQNWTTSQALRDPEAGWPASGCRPEAIARAARDDGAAVIASSYNEPLITADWAVEIFRCARGFGIAGAFVSNGNATPEVLEYLRPWVSLFKVDLKGFRPETYRALGGRLETVLDTIRRLVALEYWVEIVTLLVPGLNDDEGELRELAAFIASVDPSIPWHVTAFHPDYRMRDRRRTEARQILRSAEIGREAGLSFVYAGNLPGSVGDHESTFCPGCRELLVRRTGFVVHEIRLREGACPRCAMSIPGVWGDSPT